MLRIALITAVVAIASMAKAPAPAAPAPAALPATASPSCHPGQPLDLDCALRALDADHDGTVSPAELANFAQPPVPAFDWSPLPPPRQHAGLDFKDAATNPEPAAPLALDHDGPPTMLSALLALGALVLLLRRRPN